MTKRKYFSWTDEKRAELREFVNGHSDINEGLRQAALLFGVSRESCAGAYKYEPKRSIVAEVDPSELEPRKERVMPTRKTKEVSTEDAILPITATVTETPKLKINVHNDLNNECLVINASETVTILKVGDIIITLVV